MVCWYHHHPWLTAVNVVLQLTAVRGELQCCSGVVSDYANINSDQIELNNESRRSRLVWRSPDLSPPVSTFSTPAAVLHLTDCRGGISYCQLHQQPGRFKLILDIAFKLDVLKLFLT